MLCQCRNEAKKQLFWCFGPKFVPIWDAEFLKMALKKLYGGIPEPTGKINDLVVPDGDAFLLKKPLHGLGRTKMMFARKNPHTIQDTMSGNSLRDGSSTQGPAYHSRAAFCAKKMGDGSITRNPPAGDEADYFIHIIKETLGFGLFTCHVKPLSS